MHGHIHWGSEGFLEIEDTEVKENKQADWVLNRLYNDIKISVETTA